jgi:hypothetical protein
MAEIIPTGTAMTIDKNIAAMVSSIVAGNAPIIKENAEV